MTTQELQEKMCSGDIWYNALIDVHRWFAEAVARRDMVQVRQVLDLMQRLDLL